MTNLCTHTHTSIVNMLELPLLFISSRFNHAFISSVVWVDVAFTSHGFPIHLVFTIHRLSPALPTKAPTQYGHGHLELVGCKLTGALLVIVWW